MASVDGLLLLPHCLYGLHVSTCCHCEVKRDRGITTTEGTRRLQYTSQHNRTKCRRTTIQFSTAAQSDKDVNLCLELSFMHTIHQLFVQRFNVVHIGASRNTLKNYCGMPRKLIENGWPNLIAAFDVMIWCYSKFLMNTFTWLHSYYMNCQYFVRPHWQTNTGLVGITDHHSVETTGEGQLRFVCLFVCVVFNGTSAQKGY